MHTTPGPVVAVGGIVVAGGALLMVRRGRPPAQECWTIPGGRVERGEFLRDAVRREVREETGLEVEVGDLAGVFEVVGDDHFVILDYHARVVRGDDPVAADDATEARWVPLAAVESLPCTPRLVETLRVWGVLPAPA